MNVRISSFWKIFIKPFVCNNQGVILSALFIYGLCVLAAGCQSENNELVWNGKDNVGNGVSSGKYSYHLTNGESSIVRKMTLLR